MLRERRPNQVRSTAHLPQDETRSGGRYRDRDFEVVASIESGCGRCHVVIGDVGTPDDGNLLDRPVFKDCVVRRTDFDNHVFQSIGEAPRSHGSDCHSPDIISRGLVVSPRDHDSDRTEAAIMSHAFVLGQVNEGQRKRDQNHDYCDYNCQRHLAIRIHTSRALRRIIGGERIIYFP